MIGRARRDYGLLGDDARRAVELGLANADWYRCPVERKRMRELLERTDGRAIADTILWLALIAAFGTAIARSWFHWWTLLLMVPYGMLWCLGGDARCHEAGHRTAFRTRWLNNVVFHLGCFMTVREPIVRRWDHTRHHTDTIIVGRDREIVEQRPPRIPHVFLIFTGVPMVLPALRGMIRHGLARVADDERLLIPETEHAKMFRQSRVILGIHLALVALAIALRSLVPLVLTSFATLYGAWSAFYVALTQHVGLAEDVTDFRLNTRTVHMNFVWRFLYWNMNYHLEHHMFPMVPFHALKALHEEIKRDCPPPYDGNWQVYRTEIIPTLRRQLEDPSHCIVRPLPPPSIG